MLAGRTGSEAFCALAIPDWHHFTESDSFSSVIRDGERLGIITGQYIRVRSDYLADVFSLSGHEFAAAIPRLKQLAQIPELGMPRELAVMLTRITKQQLAIIDPERAKQITTKDFAHNRDLPRTEMPSVPEINNQVYPPLAPVSLAIRDVSR